MVVKKDNLDFGFGLVRTIPQRLKHLVANTGTNHFARDQNNCSGQTMYSHVTCKKRNCSREVV